MYAHVCPDEMETRRCRGEGKRESAAQSKKERELCCAVLCCAVLCCACPPAAKKRLDGDGTSGVSEHARVGPLCGGACGQGSLLGGAHGHYTSVIAKQPRQSRFGVPTTTSILQPLQPRHVDSIEGRR